MFRNSPTALAFVAGFVLAAASVHLATGSQEPTERALLADPAPWTQHRASVLLAQESPEMQGLRASGRLALIGPNGGPH